MLAALRRTRWIAALLLALAPGAGGELVAAFHPCPAMQSGADGSGTPSMAMAHQTGAPMSGHSHHGASTCDCVGHCSAGMVAALPMAPVVPMAFIAPAARAVWQATNPSDRRVPLPERLPPSIPPPHV